MESDVALFSTPDPTGVGTQMVATNVHLNKLSKQYAKGETHLTKTQQTRDYASQEEQLLVVGDGGNDHATGGMARTGNVDPKWPASSGGTVNLEDLEEPHNDNRGLGEQRMKRKR
eukprot:scaffold60239_cov69-Phaeocystis_antarctica.AAC.1